MRLLLVEDEPLTSRMLAKGLREHAYAVDVAREVELQHHARRAERGGRRRLRVASRGASWRLLADQGRDLGEIEGVLRTMYDPRNTLTLNVSADLQKHFGDKLYRTVIPRNIRLAEAPSFGIPALHLDKASKGAQAYLALAGEMLRRDEAAGTTTQGAMHG